MTVESPDPATAPAPAPVHVPPVHVTRRAAPPPELEEDPTDPVIEAQPGREKMREPTAYERRLRTENANLRARAQTAERELADRLSTTQAESARLVAEARAAAEAAKAEAKTVTERAAAEIEDAKAKAAEAAKAEADQRVHEARTGAEQRIVRAEVKTAAIKAGMVHMDGLKLLDMSEVKLDEAGEVVIPEDYFEKAKASLPFLFAAPPPVNEPAKTTTSSPAAPPPASPTTKKGGMELTREEWAERRREIAQGRVVR